MGALQGAVCVGGDTSECWGPRGSVQLWLSQFPPSLRSWLGVGLALGALNVL